MSTWSCFAEISHDVICVDNDESKVETLRNGGASIFEQSLPELLTKRRGKSIGFTSDPRGTAERSQFLFIAVATPQGDGDAADRC